MTEDGDALIEHGETKEWEDYPLGCPPPTASAADTAVYRIVKDSPPTQDQFLSYQELGKPLPKSPDPTLPCRWRSVSVFESRDAALQKLKMQPRLGTCQRL